jgi:hypothetical protein
MGGARFDPPLSETSMSLSDTWRLHHAPLSAAFSGRNGRQAWLGRLRLEDYEIVAKRLVGTLSAPELQVLQCLVSGMSNKGIAIVARLSMVDVERVRATEQAQCEEYR